MIGAPRLEQEIDVRVAVVEIHGQWDCGFVLDRHSLRSVLTGHDTQGRPTFDTAYTEAGRALYELKSHDNYKQVPPLAKALYAHILPRLPQVDVVVPMASQQKEGAATSQPCGGLPGKDAERAGSKEIPRQSTSEPVIEKSCNP
ncbi:hypothetical protein OTB17_20310 [Massilia sp. H27-R4]|nr:hypothetical protein [Massilia sp. H27-R4]